MLGSGKWSAGPTAIVVAFAGKSDRADVNHGFVQYFVNYNLPKAWYITSAPNITVN